MSLQITYGLFGSGKTSHFLNCAEKLWKETDKKVFFIVPEQYSYETEKALASRLGVISPKTVEVLSFKRLFYYVCNNIGGSILPKLTDTGKQIIISKVAAKCIKDLKVLGKSAAYPGFAGIVTALFSEFKRYNNAPQKIKQLIEKIDDEFLKMKMQDIALLYENYEKETANLFTDPDDELTLLADILREHSDFFANSVFFIDEFEGFTPQETSVITRLCLSAEKVNISLCTDNPENGAVFSMQKKTAQSLTQMCENYHIKAEKPLFLESKPIENRSFALMEENLRRGTYKVYSDVPDFAEILFALNRNGEIEQIAEIIVNTVRDRKYRFRDFSVVAPNTEEYQNVVSAIFKRYNISLYKSNKIPLSEETPAVAIMTAMNILVKKWDYNSVFAFLKTGYGAVSDDECDLIENYIIKTGIRGTGWTNEKPWKYTPKGFDEESLVKLEKIRQKIVSPLKTLEEKMSNSQNVRERIRALAEFMTELDFADKIYKTEERYHTEEPDISKRYEQIYSKIIDALDDIDAVCGESENVTLEEFAAMIETAFKAHTVGNIPTSADSVVFADIQRCRAAKCKFMFVVGVTDGVFPETYMNEGIIKDDERRALEELGLKMAPDTLTRTFDEDFNVYATLVHPTQRIYLSYPMADNAGGSLMPSGLIRKIKAFFPKIRETENVTTEREPLESVVSPESALNRLAVEKSKQREGKCISPVWNEVAAQLEKNELYTEKCNMILNTEKFSNNSLPLTEKNLESLYKETVYTSVSRLETYRKCPFMYFSKYILNAEPRDTVEFKTVDTGSVIHKVIEKLSLKVKKEVGSWKNVQMDWLEQTVEEISNVETELLKATLDTVEQRQLWAINRIKEAVKLSAFAVAKQLQSGEFIPMGYEISFDDDGEYKCIEIPVDGKLIKLRGKIDRGDIYTDAVGKKYIRIIDYKSGQRDFKAENLFYGMNIQLAVYLDSLTTQENAVCAGMLYVRLFDPIASVESDITTEEAQKAVERERKTTGLLVADTEIVKKMDDALEKGENSYLPVKLKVNGDFDTRSSKIASYEQFEAMNKYVRKTVKKMSRELLKGNTAISPYKLGDETPCAFCEYKKICHFDTACGNRYNYLEKINSEDAWNQILMEGNTNA